MASLSRCSCLRSYVSCSKTWVRYSEHKYKGLEAAGQALLDIQIGGNEGKSVIVVAEE